MEAKVLYSMLEMAFAEQHGISDEDMDLYNEQLKKHLPDVWYTLSFEDRISILDEAIKNNQPIKETDSYKNLYPEGTYTISK